MRLTFLALLLAISTNSFGQKMHDLEGRWDLTVDFKGKTLPSWLEVKNSGVNTLVGHFVSYSGSARPISEVNVDGSQFGFSIPKQWEPAGQDLSLTGNIQGQTISGSITHTDGEKYTFTGVRAPKLEYTNNPTWGEPIDLFNEKDLAGWKTSGKNQWKVLDGVLTSEQSGSNLISEQKFEDFKLHIEFKYPEGSNSGVYLRGRYEVQIADNVGMDPSNILFGGVYGFLTPTENMAKEAGKWQSFDITLIGNRITIIANGRPVIIDQAIPGITGGALDSNEGEAGPFMIQGDHGPVEYRNIIVTPRIN